MIAHVADKLCLQLCMHTLIAPYFTGTPLNILPVAPLYALGWQGGSRTDILHLLMGLRQTLWQEPRAAPKTHDEARAEPYLSLAREELFR